MHLITLSLLSIGAFFLGACPFALWIGRRFLKKDIRKYGDANPGSWNVLRAGGRKTFALALLLDAGKGVPFVLIGDLVFELSLPELLIIGFCAILGHAFSFFLHFHGGKAVAVTYGMLLALPQREMVVILAICMVIYVLLIESHAWVVILGAASTLLILVLRHTGTAEILFLIALSALLVFRYFPELKTMPGYKGVLVNLFQAGRR